MAFDEAKKELIVDLGKFNFNNDSGFYHIEIVSYDGGVAQTSCRRFRVTGEGDDQKVLNDRNKAWLKPDETHAMMEGLTVAHQWHTDNPATVQPEA